MKIKNSYTRLSILLSFLILLIKLVIEFTFFTLINNNSSKRNLNDFASSLIMDQSQNLITVGLIPSLAALILAILGVRYYNRHRYFGLFFCIITLIVSVTPASLFIFIP
ncbi:hypothetical protein [Aureivirga marina]|uniref:hypothetical protein n=1 Tax=Aureivirga marina TaxID=1182451 RepID=UPI0018CA6815|nr:hypothetical protein [Aureivirga marina]